MKKIAILFGVLLGLCASVLAQSLTDNGAQVGWLTSSVNEGTTYLNCGETLGFYDNRGPNNRYDKNQDIWHTIKSPNGTRIRITFTQMDLGTNTYLDFYSSDYNTNSNPHVTGTNDRRTGTNTNLFTSTGNVCTVHFKSSSNTTRNGWKATISVLGCPSPVNLPCGSSPITIGGSSIEVGGSTYTDDIFSEKTFTTAMGSNLTLMFTDLPDDGTNDRIEVYDGADFDARRIATINASSTTFLSTPIVSNGNALSFKFFSNASNNGTWSATLEPDPCFTQNPGVSLACGETQEIGGTYGASDYYATTYSCSDPNARMLINLFSLPNDGSNDYVEVYDGDLATGSRMGRFHGDENTVLYASSNTLTVLFRSNATNNGSWGASVSAVCPEVIASPADIACGSSYVINESNAEYANLQYTRQVFRAADANARLVFDFTALPDDGDNDKVLVYDGEGATATLRGIYYHGESAPSAIYSSTNVMTVEFFSNEDVTGVWNATVSAICIDVLDEQSLGCDGAYAINSTYTNLQYTRQVFRATDPEAQVHLDFAVVNGSGVLPHDNANDYVEVYDGEGASMTLIGRYYGFGRPRTVSSVGPVMTVIFMSNSTVDGTWSAAVTVDCPDDINMPGPGDGHATYTTCNAIVYDDGGASGNYSAGLNDEYIVLRPGRPGSVLYLEGEYNFDWQNDWITIYDGEGTDGEVIWGGGHHGHGYPRATANHDNQGNPSQPCNDCTNCLSSTPTASATGAILNNKIVNDGKLCVTYFPKVTSKSGALTIRFHTNGSQNCAGFSFHVSCVPKPTDCYNTGVVIFSEDFGGNSVSDPLYSTSGISSTICSYSMTNNAGMTQNGGHYVLRKNACDEWQYFNYIDDHTHPGNIDQGYLFNIDASSETGFFYKDKIDLDCDGVDKLLVSFWVANVNNQFHTESNYPNLLVGFYSDQECTEELASVSTGPVPEMTMYGCTSDANEWQYYSLELPSVPAGLGTIWFKIANQTNTDNGNDFVLDDIEVRACLPPSILTRISGGQEIFNSANVCAGEELRLLASLDETLGAQSRYETPYYAWERGEEVTDPNDPNYPIRWTRMNFGAYDRWAEWALCEDCERLAFTNGEDINYDTEDYYENYNDITIVEIPSPTAPAYTHYYYRIIVAGSLDGLNSQYCRSVSEPYEITVTRIPEIEFGGTNAICEGGTINLGVTSTSPTPGTWTIYSEKEGTVENTDPSTFHATLENTASGYQVHGAVHDTIIIQYTTSPENGGCWNRKKIPIYTLPDVTITPLTTTICEGSVITLHPSSNQVSSFQWDGGPSCSGTDWESGNTCADWPVSPITTTTYTLTVTTPHNILDEDGNDYVLNCVSDTNKVVTVLLMPTGLNVAGIPATPICPGTSVTLIPSATGSGTGTLYYSWDGTTYVEAGDDGFTLTITPDATVSYTLYVKEVRTVGGVEYDCAPAELPVTVDVYDQPVLSIGTLTHLNCNGVNDGKIPASATGGTPFAGGYYEFSLDNVHFTHNTGSNLTQWTFTELMGGDYTVYVRDQHCTDSRPVTLTQPDAPLTAWIHYPIVETCDGQSVGEASVAVSGGTPFGTAPSTYYEYEWNTSPVQTTATATGLAEQAYIVEVTDSKGCTATATVDITARDVPQYTLGGNNLTKCLSDPATELSVNLAATNPAEVESYSWSIASGAHAGMPATTTGAALNAITVTPDAVGDYTYTVVVAAENGCSVTSDYSLTISPIPTIALATGSGAKDQTKCYNEFQSGFTPIIFTYGGGATGVNFTWTSTPAPTCLSYNAGTMTISAVSAAPTAGATYTYRIETTTATGNACAQASIEGSITIRPELTVSVTANHTACENEDIGVATALGQGGNPGTGSNPPYTYLWDNSETTATIDELAAGTYSVTVTDDAGCSATNSVVIVEKTNPTISISKQNVNCYGETTGSIEVTVTNHGTTASTSNPYTDGPTAQPNYYVFSTDDGTTTENSSGTNYESHTFSVSTNGEETSYTYNIYVRDGNDCTVRQNVVITQPTLLRATINPTDITETCDGQSVGEATVTPVGGTQGTSPSPAYTYAWNTYPTASWGTNRTTQTISDLPEGSYRVTVTDAHGCEATATVAIEARPVPNFTLSVDGDDSKCYYDRETEIVVSNGVTGSTYAWSASATEAGLPAGSDGATVTVTPTVANTYTYNVTITVANACVVTASVPLTIYPVPTVEAPSSSIVEATCYGYDGSFTLVATGGTIFSDGPTATPYYYQFSIDGGTEENFYSNVNSQVQHTIDGQTAGTYNVVVSDFNGCTASVTGGVEVWQPTAVTATIDSNDIIETCDGQSVGEATVTPGGGRPGTAPAPAYTYAWNTYPTATWGSARTTQTISDLPEGSYSVTVTDGYGCIGSTVVAIGARQVPSINATSTLNDVCLSAPTSTLNVLNNNTLPIASHSWSVTPTDGAGMPADNTTASLTVTPTASATAAVTYTYTDVVTAENGCVVSGDVVLTVNPTAILTHTSGTLDQTLCFEKTLTPIVFEYSGGATGVTLTWTDGTPATTCLNYAVDNTAHTLTISEGSTPVAGTYRYTVQTTGAISPCENPSYSGTIIIRPELTVSVTADHQSCVTGNIGVATAHPLGGKPFGTSPDTYYTYLWSNTKATATIDELEGGTYNVTVTDANTCTATASVTIVEKPNPVVAISDVATLCPEIGTTPVAASITTATTADYTYTWTNDGSFAVTTTNPVTTTATSETATVSVPDIATAGCSNTYTLKLQVEDANNCLSNLAEKVITVEDVTEPALIDIDSWPANITGQNHCFAQADTTGLWDANEIKALFSDCSNITVTVEDVATTTSNCGWTWLRTYTITDACDNIYYVTGTTKPTMSVSGKDLTKPELTGTWPENITNQNNCFANADISGLYSNEQVADLFTDCSPITVTSVDANTLTDDCGWTITRTYTIKDECNNTVTPAPTMSVSGKDQNPPTYTVPPTITVYKTDACTFTADTAVTHSVPTALADDCSDVDDLTLTYTDSGVITATCTDTIKRTWRLVDVCGNVSVVDSVQLILITDTIKPTIARIVDAFPALGVGSCQYEIPDLTGQVTVGDNCTAVADLVITQDPVAGTTTNMNRDVTITVTDKCGNSRSTTILVEYPSDIHVQANPPVICKGQTTTLTVYSGGISTYYDYIWNHGIDATTGTPDNTNTVTVSPEETTTYHVNITNDNNCTQGAELTVTVKPLPVITFTDLGNICPNVGTQEIVANIEATTPGYTYTWTSGLALDGTENGTQDETQFTIGVVVPNDYNNNPENCDRTNWIKLHVTDNDALHCEYEATYTIVIKDDEAPQLITAGSFPTGEENMNLCYADRPAATPDNDIKALYTDNCSDFTVTHTTVESGNNCSWTVRYTYTITDLCGNTVDPAPYIEYTGGDTEDPTITCPRNYSVRADADHNYATLTIPVPATADNCEVISVVNDFNSTDDASGHYPLGTTTVTYTVTDGCNHSVDCSFTVVVRDSTPPCIGCDHEDPIDPYDPDDPDGITCESIVATMGGASGTFNISTSNHEDHYHHGDNSWNITYNDNTTDYGEITAVCNLTGATTATGLTTLNGQDFAIGTTTVTWIVTDTSNNSSSCSFIVVVSDDEDPCIGCDSTDITDPFNPDNPNGISCESIVASFHGSVEIGTTEHLNYYLHSDNSWNITVNDNVGIDSVTYTVSGATTVINAPNTTLNGQHFEIGTTRVTWTVVDVSGHSVSCEFDVIITDDEDPCIGCDPDDPVDPFNPDDPQGISCADIVAAMGGTAGRLEVATSNNLDYYLHDNDSWNITASDNVGIRSIVYSVDGATTAVNAPNTTLNGQHFEIGETTVTWTVTDVSGRTSTCSFTVVVSDDEPPCIGCDPTDPVDPFDPNDPQGVSCASIVAAMGGSASTVSVGTSDHLDYYLHGDDTWNITASDNVGVASIVYSVSGSTTTVTEPNTTLNGQRFEIGTTLVTWTVTDVSGLTSTCEFTVVVTDDEDPCIGCDPDDPVDPFNPDDPQGVSCADIVAAMGGTAGRLEVATTNNLDYYLHDNDSWNITASDNVGIFSIVYSVDGATTTVDAPNTTLNGQNFEIGETTVTWTVTDVSGRTSTCEFTVVVSDEEPPCIGCDPTDPIDPFNPDDPQGVSCASIVEAMGGSGSTFNVGTSNHLDYYLHDDDTWNITASDNVGVVSIVYSLSGSTTTVTEPNTTLNGQRFEIGTTLVTWTVTDATGLESTCEFTVVVTDDEEPCIGCDPTDPDDPFNPNDPDGVSCLSITNNTGNVNVNTSLGQTSYLHEDDSWNITANDNSAIHSITYSVSGATTTVDGSNRTLNGQRFNIGTTVVTWTVVDYYGLTSTCDFTVTVTDIEPPTISCPSAISNIACIDDVPPAYATYALFAAAGGSAYDVNGIDESSFALLSQTSDGNTCPEVLTRTYQIADIAGNTQTCTQTITVRDTIAPLITGAQPTLNVGQGQNCQFPLPDFTSVVRAMSEDNCTSNGDLYIEQVPQANTTIITSNTDVTIFVSDACGNTSRIIGRAVVPQPLEHTVSFSEIMCAGETSVVTIGAQGGTAPYNGIGQIVEPTGTHNYTVSDANGCTSDFEVVITQPQLLQTEIPDTGVLNVACYGLNTGYASVSVIGGTPDYTFVWSTTPVQTTQRAVNLVAGGYTVTVTDTKGCTSTSAITITQPAAELMTSFATTNVTNVVCYGEATGSASVTVTGGTTPYEYSWNTSPEQTTANATNLVAGDYTVTVTDAHGCTSYASVNIAGQSELLMASIAEGSVTDVACYGQSTGSASVTVAGGTPGYTYRWNSYPAQTTQTATNLPAGEYVVVVTDTHGCTSTASATISGQSYPLVASFADGSVVDVLCFGEATGSASVTASGGTPDYTYRWNTSPQQTTSTVTNLPAGLYIVTVTDSHGCTTTSSARVNGQGSPISASFMAGNVTNIPCYGMTTGSATVTVNGGTPEYLYAWNTEPMQTTPTAQSLPAGNYDVTITDAHGCTTTASTAITQPALLEVSATSGDATCGSNGGSVTAIVIGGAGQYEYMWTNSAGQNYTGARVTNIAPSTYNLVVTDFNGCTATAVTSVRAVGSISARIEIEALPGCGNNESAGRLQAVPESGISPFTYSWNNGSTGVIASNLSAGSYSLTITDSWGCTAYAATNIENSNDLEISVSATSISCFGDSNATVSVVALHGQQPYTYAWNNGANSPVVQNVTAGRYSITVIDANMCAKVETIEVTQPDRLVLESNVKTISCHGKTDGSIALNAIGGTEPYSFSIIMNDNFHSGNYLSGLPAGTYSLEVSDANGCLANNTIQLVEPEEFTSSYNVGMPSCNGNNDGFIEISAMGGTKPYMYGWDSYYSDVPMITGLRQGQYTISVVDANKCTYQVASIMLTDMAGDCIKIPNVFTPNGDGVNDTWIIENIEMFPDATVYVFNRWGQMLYKGTGNDEPWDGSYRGHYVPAGTYLYIVDLYQKTEAYKGTVTIIY